jgi:uncharacterized RDD family membrane protein YckC
LGDIVIEPSVDDDRPRAGFWRRFAALLIDMAVVLIPLQIVLVIVFAQTNGAVQGSFGITSTACAPVDTLPEGIDPIPPADFNTFVECRTSLFGFDTQRVLTVSKVTQTENTSSSLFYSYDLGADGRPRSDVWDAGWVSMLLLLVYLVVMEFRTGATLGKRVLSIKVRDVANPLGVGVPFGKAAGRNLAMMIGAIPLVMLQIITWLRVAGGGADPLETLLSSFNIAMTIIGGLVILAWLIWIVISVARKRDPIYDWLAGTTVVRPW